MGCGSAGITKGRTSSSSGRFSEGDAARFPAFAGEMVQLRVDLVIAITTPAALAVTHVTQTIPVVMTTAMSRIRGNWVSGEPGATRRQR